jgi:hypothetical protein
MAYDEGLAERIRGVLDEQPGVSEKRMYRMLICSAGSIWE